MTFFPLLILLVFSPILLLVVAGKLYWQPREMNRSNPTLLLLLAIGLGFMVFQGYAGAIRAPRPVINPSLGTPHEVVQPETSGGVGIIGIWLILAFGFGGSWFGFSMAHRWRNPSQNGHTDAALQKRIQSRAWIGFVPLLIAAALPVIQQFREQSRRAEIATGLRALGESLHRSGIVTSSASLPFPDFTLGISALQPLNSDTAESLPDWTRQTQTVIDGREVQVIVSQQYSTEAEAKADCDAQLRKKGEQLLREQWEPVFGGPRRPSFDVNLPPFVITKTHVQTVQRDFGSFSAPMYRVWYQVQKSVNRDDAWRISWENEVKKSRTFLLGCVVGGLLLLPLSIVAAGQFSRMLGMQDSGGLVKLLVPAVAALWIAGAFWLNQSLLLWPTPFPSKALPPQPIETFERAQN